MAKTSNYMRRLSLISLLYLQGLLEIWARSGYSVQSPFAASNPHRRLSSQAPQKGKLIYRTCPYLLQSAWTK